MAELAVAEDDKQAALDFNSGFDTETPPAPPAANPDPAAKIEATPTKPEPKAPTKAALKAEPVAPPPEYVQITKEQFDRFESAATKTAGFETQLSKAFGTMGNLQQIVTKLQSATPAGMTVELPADVVSEMEADFPELAGHMRKSLEKALKGIRGTGTADATGATTDPEAVQKLVNEAAKAESLKNELEALEDAHPTWREIVGAVDSPEKADPANPFRKWLATQTAEYQTKINSAKNSAVISRAIDKFQADTKAPAKELKPAPKDAARIDRIKDAIQPRGDGSLPSSGNANTEVDHFNAGYASG